jgi:hypothetical protein
MSPGFECANCRALSFDGPPGYTRGVCPNCGWHEEVWHPEPPPDLRPALTALVARNVDCVLRALEGIVLESPAFAVCLELNDEPDDVDDLYPYCVSIGQEAERKRLLDSLSPWEAWVEVWNSGGYALSELDVPDPRDDPEVGEAAGEVSNWLSQQGIHDGSLWVFEEVAFHMTRNPPHLPTTTDFVAFVSEQGEDVVRSLRWIVPPELQRQLETKRLLPDHPNELPGAPDYGWVDED